MYLFVSASLAGMTTGAHCNMRLAVGLCIEANRPSDIKRLPNHHFEEAIATNKAASRLGDVTETLEPDAIEW